MRSTIHRTTHVLGVIGVVLTLLLSCGQQPEPEVTPLTADEISGDRLWTRIAEEAPYTTYGFWTGHAGFQQGQAPHGPIHRIFANSAILDSLPTDDRTAPNGTVIVKENRLGDRTLTGYTVMAKVAGYAPETNDWFWARYDPDGTVMAEGTVGNCISCHSGVRRNDYIVSYPLDLDPQTLPSDE